MPSKRRNLKVRLGPRYARTRSGSPEPRRGHSKSLREKDPERRTVFKRLEKGVFHRLGDKKKNVSIHSRGSERKSYYSSRRDTESCYQSSRSKEAEIASEKHRHKREYSRRTKICYFDFLNARMPSHIKTYDGSEDPEDHLKIFQAAAKTECWAMPTWCNMFNSTLTGNARVWFDDLPKESIDSYDDLRKAFLENYIKQKKCIKDPVEIHNIKQRDGESTEEFVRSKFRSDIKNQLIPENTPLVGFSGEIIWPLGQISLLVKIGDEEHSTSAWMNFIMIRSPSSYNGIIGKPGDLNKVCPKDGYPLSKIDWKVESLCGYPYKCFLDAYKGYHQIKIAGEDEEKTTFITSQGIFCYSKMPFGLKNAEATYQRLMDEAFQKQIG
uniref:Reverse transcriptase domain-containing protein n=1 Tax=Tanacetum cinerariifolium TaxID=118510 RepID=A0A6L2KGN1_TANCI|nr:reverse transcriptase domain-containing protein [Tanacetum cinerariifolium]